MKLSTTIIILVGIVVLSALVVTSILISNTVREAVRHTAEEKSQVVSRTIAHSEIVKSGLQHQQDEQKIQEYTSEIQSVTDVSFIVVMDMNGIRKSHPKPERIGKKFQGGDEYPVLHGRASMSESKGTLGKSLRSFTPIYDGDEQIGAVAVGIPMENVNEAFANANRDIILGAIFGILVGIVGAILLSRYIKKILHGLEPSGIAQLLGERNTMLQSVHEGIVAVNRDGRINLVNKSAQDIFNKAGLPSDPIGMPITDYMDSTQLPTVLETGKPEHDEEQNINGLKILVNRVPLYVNNEIVGAISTFRDKTEMDQLSQQLVGVQTYAETLRAQSHEFRNRLHVIQGMLQMENYDDLQLYINDIVEHGSEEDDNIATHIKDAALAGFLIGKLSLAREQNITLTIINKTVIPEPQHSDLTHEIITIVGNLIDNSMDSLTTASTKSIDVQLKYDLEHLYIDVIDSGKGLCDEVKHKIFEKGYSTKGNHRGYGLYLVKQSIDKVQGNITITTPEHAGTMFSVTIPYPERRREQ